MLVPDAKTYKNIDENPFESRRILFDLIFLACFLVIWKKLWILWGNIRHCDTVNYFCVNSMHPLKFPLPYFVFVVLWNTEYFVQKLRQPIKNDVHDHNEKYADTTWMENHRSLRIVFVKFLSLNEFCPHKQWVLRIRWKRTMLWSVFFSIFTKCIFYIYKIMPSRF